LIGFALSSAPSEVLTTAILGCDDANLEAAIAGYNLLLAPYEPIPGFRVAVIEDSGCPIELVQTSLDDAELWKCAGRRQTPLQVHE
jgi:hypothetical protein